jgi:manganese transport protein
VADGLIPRFDGVDSVLLATAMLGATVMPHAVYLHSGLARDRHGHPPPGAQRARLLRATRWDVGTAMLVAGTVNLALLLVAATNLRGQEGTDTIEGAHSAVADTLGPGVALFFAVGLLASGLASTSVGAYAGAMIMQGLLRRKFPLLVRRLVTLLPALLVLASGVDPTRALVLSQVVLSFGIPFALIPLVRLTGNPAVMGADVNRTLTSALAWLVAALITLLNVALIYLTIS